MTNEVVHYVPGKGKANKASYLIGTEKIPAAVVTRLLTAIQDQAGAKLDRVFYQSLEKYPAVLDALDTYGLAPADAVAAFIKIRNETEKANAPRQQRASRVQKAAEAFAKSICKRFKGSPVEVVDAFFEMVTKPEFRKETLDVVSAFEKNFGHSSLGHIKTSNRKGNPAAQKAIKKHREQKKK
jgi:hypothetical protein